MSSDDLTASEVNPDADPEEIDPMRSHGAPTKQPGPSEAAGDD